MPRASDSLDDRRQELADRFVAHPGDESPPAVDSARIEPLDELDRLCGRGRRPELDLDRVGDARPKRAVGAVELARAVSDPWQMGREQVHAIALGPKQ